MIKHKFKIGKRYSCVSPCDHNCKWTFEVINRTAKTVKIKNEDGEIITRYIKIYAYGEFCEPLGSYSRAPFLKAQQ